MNSKKIVFSVFVFILLITSLIVGVILVKQNQNLKEKANPATSLYITPSTQSITRGSNVSFIVKMDTGTNLITALDLRILFNPQALEITSIQQGSGITAMNQTIKNTIDNTNGKIMYIVYMLDKTQAVHGTAVEDLIINATVKSTAALGTYQLTFDPFTGASALNEEQNVITVKTGATYQVTSTPTPTPSPTKSPSPTPTRSPSPTPTRSPSPTPTRSPSPTPTRSPSPTPTRSPSPTPTPSNSPSPSPTPTRTPGIAGDVDLDGHVNYIDLGLVIQSYLTTPPSDPRADLDGNGTVDIGDIGIVVINYEL